MKAPGQISKPFAPSKPRGRPPLSKKILEENQHEPEIGFTFHSSIYKENF